MNDPGYLEKVEACFNLSHPYERKQAWAGDERAFLNAVHPHPLTQAMRQRLKEANAVDYEVLKPFMKLDHPCLPLYGQAWPIVLDNASP